MVQPTLRSPPADRAVLPPDVHCPVCPHRRATAQGKGNQWHLTAAQVMPSPPGAINPFIPVSHPFLPCDLRISEPTTQGTGRFHTLTELGGLGGGTRREGQLSIGKGWHQTADAPCTPRAPWHGSATLVGRQPCRGDGADAWAGHAVSVFHANCCLPW